jgi:hypothetical protein
MEENRRQKRDPFTQGSANLLAGKLNKVSQEEAVARLETAVMSGWKGAFFPGDEHKYAHLRGGSSHSQNGHGKKQEKLPGQTDFGY